MEPQKQQALLDSLFRRYYVPRIVLREVRLNDDRSVNEVIDGQQRIATVQRFYADKLALPDSLKDLNPELPGKRYSELPVDIRRFVNRLSYQADTVKGIDDPLNPAHQKIAHRNLLALAAGRITELHGGGSLPLIQSSA